MSSSYQGVLLLASASPRRHQLLTQAGVRFEAIESGVQEERMAGEAAAPYAMRLAQDKARAVAVRYPAAIVLGADTVVAVGDEVLEKPRDRDHARWMIGRLAGRAHQVITGFALIRTQQVLECRAVSSIVTFRKLSVGEIEAYVATDEPYDKAGAYAVQGQGRSLIEKVEGSLTNVMGLPIEEVMAALVRHGIDGTRGAA
ncbi:MAG TPA: Maf family protein [Candidatus Binataceae bacterium]|nr:Maf family protein [Candidatus Binataceae bacterium]